MPKHLLRNLLLAVTLVTASGCGIIDMIYLPPAEDTAQEIFEAANDAMADHNYVRAVQLYNKLKDAYPFSPYTVDAELSLGDAYYLDEEYALAAENYKDFESFHPRHKAIPYVLYQIGMSLMKQFQSIDRPTTELDEAVSYFERVIQQYPARRTPRARRRISASAARTWPSMSSTSPTCSGTWKSTVPPGAVMSTSPRITPMCLMWPNTPGRSPLPPYHEYTVQENEQRRQAREGSWHDWFKWL